jgi:hypothetical protein
MTKTKLLLAGLLTGAVAFGTACKTDKGTTNTGTDTNTMATDAGTGGTGLDNPHPDIHPLPQEGTREMEPGVHEGTIEEPGTGGTGLGPEPIDRMDPLGGETSDEPLNPGAPAHQPTPDEGMMDDNERTPSPRH